MNKLKFLFLFLFAFTSACASASPSRSPATTLSEGTYQSTAAPGSGSGSGGGRADDQSASKSSAANSAAPGSPDLDKIKEQPNERKIIRNADLTLESSAPEDSQQKISAIAESKGGFVLDSQQSASNAQATTHDRVTMTVRVPADKFDEALTEIKKAANRVVVETVKAQDVTEEFVDIEARLSVKKAQEAQFLDILKQAHSVADTLQVQNELTKVRTEIEQIEGRKKFLENQTNLSTIRLTIQTPTAFSANTSGFVYQLGQSVSNGFEFALGFILVFISFIIAIIPFLVLVVLPICLLARYFWRRFMKRRLANKLSKEEHSE